MGFVANVGGAKRDRTADLLHAMQALSQLSYGPVTWSPVWGPGNRLRFVLGDIGANNPAAVPFVFFLFEKAGIVFFITGFVVFAFNGFDVFAFGIDNRHARVF